MSFKLTPKLKSLIRLTIGGYGTFCLINIYKGDEKFYKSYIMPVIHLLEPEQAHKLAIWASKHRLLPKSSYRDPDILKVEIFGKEFSNPIGIAAGFDKHGEAVIGLTDIGFGFVEIGSVTPKPQDGNEKPRVFRLTNDMAVINRYGFNSEGHDIVYERLKELKSGEFNGILGVNLGKNKLSNDGVRDYVDGIKTFGLMADYLVINISSPNTPGLRNFQLKDELIQLLRSTIKIRDALPLKRKPPLLLKIAPDLSSNHLEDVAKIIQMDGCKVDGLIISNTTIQRPDYLINDNKKETGGLSGLPLKDVSTKLIADMYKLTNGKVTIIGVGGVFSGRDAYDKIKAGASMVQIYTSLIYEGPPIVTRIKKELADLIEADGYTNVSQCIGIANK